MANKSTRMIKIKSNNMENLSNEIQDLIYKNIKMINTNLEKIQGKPS